MCASTSITMRSPSATNAIGPPSTASGATWPTQKPCVPPEKRPSVTSAASPPRPAPFIAPVTASISRMPGPALRALVADDDDVAGVDRARRGSPPSPRPRRRSTRAVPSKRVDVDAGDLHHRALRRERAARGPRCRPARGSGRVSGCTTVAVGRGRVEVGEVLGHRLAGDGEAVAVEQPGVEQLAASRPARRRSRSRSAMWYLPCGFMSAMCGHPRGRPG